MTGGDATESVAYGKGNVYKNLCQFYATRQQGILFIHPMQWLIRMPKLPKSRKDLKQENHTDLKRRMRVPLNFRVFEHKVSESFKELACSQDASGENGEKNTLPLPGE